MLKICVLVQMNWRVTEKLLRKLLKQNDFLYNLQMIRKNVAKTVIKQLHETLLPVL